MSMPDDRRDPWRRRGGTGDPFGDFPDFFADFEKEFHRMRGMMQRIMEDAMQHASGPRRHEPFVYGFSMRVGPDGQPVIQPFGNTAGPVIAPDATANAPTPAQEPGREPLTDIFEGEDEVGITVEMPGVEKKDISLHVTERAITIRVDKGRKYHKQIQLPAKVVPSSAKATYKNGVLDLTLKRADEKRDPGQRVDIE